MTTITPTVGRIVWYRGADGEIRPAIVTKGNGPFNADLYVFPLDGADTDCGTKTTVTHADPEQEPGCFQSWHWMPYQKQQAAKQANELAPIAEVEAFVDRLARQAVSGSRSNWAGAGLDFGTALLALKDGKRVARAGWNGSGQWVALGKGADYLAASQFWNEHARAHAEQNGGGAMVLPYFILKTAQGAILMGWTPSQSDALAQDWHTFE